jgi:hypothetical protein
MADTIQHAKLVSGSWRTCLQLQEQDWMIQIALMTVPVL